MSWVAGRNRPSPFGHIQLSHAPGALNNAVLDNYSQILKPVMATPVNP